MLRLEHYYKKDGRLLFFFRLAHKQYTVTRRQSVATCKIKIKDICFPITPKSVMILAMRVTQVPCCRDLANEDFFCTGRIVNFAKD